jgi:hypothetical protein
MARELGLPARYVQGYFVSDGNLGLGLVSVTDRAAHAWPEVYFRGVGWIPFEPTPGFSFGRYRYWLPLGDAVGAAFYERPEKPAEAEESASEWVEPLEEKDYRFLEVVLVVLGASLAGAIVLLVADRLLKRWSYRRFSVAERFIEQVRLNLRIMAVLGYRLLPGETLAEFAERVRQEEAALSLRFVKPLELLIYRGDAVEEDSLAMVLADRKEVYQMIKQASKWKYYWLRLRMAI